MEPRAPRILSPYQEHLWKQVKPETWKIRSRFLLSAIEFATQQRCQYWTSLEYLLLSWILAMKGVLDTTKKTYCGHAIGICNILLQPHPGLTLIEKTFRHLGPASQAVPIKKSQVIELLRKTSDPGRRVAFFLCWKTASRVADISPLKRENFLVLSAEEIIIHFTAGKVLSKHPFKSYAVVIIHDKDSMKFVVDHVSKFQVGTLVFPHFSTPVAYTALKKFNPDLSAHSFKRGAIDVLADRVAEGVIPVTLLSHLAKHSSPEECLSETTVRYINNPVKVGRIFHTERATILL